MRIKAAIFDLDGVITDTALHHYHAWRYLADGLGISFTVEDNESLKGLDRMASLDWILKKGNLHLDMDTKLALAEKKNTYYQKVISQMSSKDILPGVIQALDVLRSKQIKIALGSASKNAVMVLTKIGLLDYFEYIVDASLVKNSKPHPETFIRAAIGLNVLPKDCIAIEDSIAGITAIRAAGMLAIGVGEERVLHDAHILLNDMTEFDFNVIQTQYTQDTCAIAP